MVFNSSAYLVFFPLVVAMYYLLPHKWRWLMLLVASCWFYMAFVPVYILILAFTIGVDYCAGILIENSEGVKRKRWLIASIIANVGVLAFFKYWNFLNTNIGELIQSAGVPYTIPDLGIVLPIGLSFHTFQSLSYTVEVYRGNQKAERNLGYFALYVMYFPQLVAGPIERPGALLPQLHQKHSLQYDNLIHGLTQMALGFLKKVVVADRIADYVTVVYTNPNAVSSWAVLFAAFLFAVQIYCDFSGYSDIAIGSARVMGVKLMTNFDRPYLSASTGEFWRRWHISLSSWLRDYVYYPMGGSRVGRWRWYYNLLFTFTLSGLWHGAAWHYILFGTFQAVVMIWGDLVKRPVNAAARALGLYAVPRVHHVLNVLHTLLIWSLGLVMFRAVSMRHAGIIYSRILDFDGTIGLHALALKGAVYPAIMCLFVTGLLILSYRLPKDLNYKYPRAFMVAVAMLVIVLGKYGDQFYYFQF